MEKILEKSIEDQFFSRIKREVIFQCSVSSMRGKKISKSDIVLDVINNSNVNDETSLGVRRVMYEVSRFKKNYSLTEDKISVLLNKLFHEFVVAEVNSQ